MTDTEYLRERLAALVEIAETMPEFSDPAGEPDAYAALYLAQTAVRGGTVEGDPAAGLTPAARYILRAVALVERAREEMAPAVEAYQAAHPFRMTGLNSLDFALEQMAGQASTAEGELKKAGLWHVPEAGTGWVAVHRDLPGEHVFDADTCWCRPVAVAPGSLKDSEEVAAEVEALDG